MSKCESDVNLNMVGGVADGASPNGKAVWRKPLEGHWARLRHTCASNSLKLLPFSLVTAAEPTWLWGTK